jgi:hypothetical protein
MCVAACGVPPANVTPLIINGIRPKINEFPWHASLYYDEAKTFFCGSSIITENLLITAAHCVFDESTREVRNASLIYVATGNIYRDYDYPDHNRFIPDLVQKNQVCRYTYNIINLYVCFIFQIFIFPFAGKKYLYRMQLSGI